MSIGAGARSVRAEIDHHAEIVRQVAVLIVDGQLAEVLLAHEDFGGLVALGHDPNARIAEQLLEIAVEFTDFLGVHAQLPFHGGGSASPFNDGKPLAPLQGPAS